VKEKILEILDTNCDYTLEEIALMVDATCDEVAKAIDEMKNSKIILRNKSIINWDKTEKEFVSALIEVKVSPQRGEGFDKIAERIYKFPEVKSLYLIAGAFDLTLIIEGKTMHEVASFVASRLAPLEFVISTSTHFVLKKYKEHGFLYEDDEKDNRQVITL